MLTDLDATRQLKDHIYGEGWCFVKAKAISWNQEQTVFRIYFRIHEHRRSLSVDLKELNTDYFILSTGEKVFFTVVYLTIPNGKKKIVIAYWRLGKD